VGDVQEELIGDLVGVNAVRVRVWDGVGHLVLVPEAAVSARVFLFRLRLIRSRKELDHVAVRDSEMKDVGRVG
jgi:hypothetical protein